LLQNLLLVERLKAAKALTRLSELQAPRWAASGAWSPWHQMLQDCWMLALPLVLAQVLVQALVQVLVQVLVQGVLWWQLAWVPG